MNESVLNPFHPTAQGGGLAVSQSSGIAVVKAKSNRDYDADEQRWSELMVAAQAGDEVRYQQLLTELSTVIKRYLVSRLGRHEFIEDCVQDSLIAIHQARHTYRSERPFRPWLFAIVRNKSIDMLRRNKSYEKALDAHTEQALEDSDGGLSPYSGQAMDTSITQGRLIEALAPPFRQVIVLTKLIGFTNAEAAKELNISETAVKVRVHRAIAKLKSLLEAEEL